MFQEIQDFFKRDGDDERFSSTAGKIGVWLLHLCKVAFLVYSGSHGINAAWAFAGSSVPMKIAQTIGIIIIEVVLFGLYLSFMNHVIRGRGQMIAGGITYVIGFILACIGIIADSQLNSGLTLTNELAFYLHWGLPIAPAIMAAGAFVTHLLDPDQDRARKRVEEEEKTATMQFKMDQEQERATMKERHARTAFKVMSKQAVMQEVLNFTETPAFRTEIRREAQKAIPAMLADIGMQVDFDKLTNMLPSVATGSNDTPRQNDTSVPFMPIPAMDSSQVAGGSTPDGGFRGTQPTAGASAAETSEEKEA